MKPLGWLGVVCVFGLFTGGGSLLAQSGQGQMVLGLFGCTADSPNLVNPSASGSNYRLAVSSYLDGSRFDSARGIAVDSKGNIIVTGGTTSPDFPTTAGAHDRTYATGGDSVGSQGPMDAFVTKIDPEGKLIWSTFLGGPNYDRAYAVEVDPQDNIYVAGRAGDGFPTTPGVLQREFAGDSIPNGAYGHQDGFVTKFTPEGQLVYSTYFGGPGRGFIRSFDVDEKGRTYLGFLNVNRPFPYITENAYQRDLGSGKEMVYAKLSADGSRVLYATYYGSEDSENRFLGAPGVRVAPDGSVVIAVGSVEDDVPVTPNAFQKKNGGEMDMIIAKFDPNDAIVFSTYYGGSGEEGAETHPLELDGEGNIFVAGATNSSDLPGTAKGFQPNRQGKGEGFVVKIAPDGSAMLGATYLGGSSGDFAEGIAVLPNQQVLLSFTTNSDDFPVTRNALSKRRNGDRDAAVVVLENDLSQVAYSSYLGGSGFDSGRAAAVSPQGDIVVAGETASSNFTLVNALDRELSGEWAAFFGKFAP